MTANSTTSATGTTTTSSQGIDHPLSPSVSHMSSPEEESILSFLTTDFLESQTTHAATFDSAQFFDTLPADSDIKYQDLLHPPSPPTSVSAYSESSGSPQNSNMDSCDEGSGSDINMDGNPLDYWQYVYSDLAQPITAFPILADPSQQKDSQQQPGAWPILPNVNASLLQPSVISSFSANAILDSSAGNSPAKRNHSASPNAPPSPAPSVKVEKRTKRAKKQTSTPSQPAAFAPLAPLKPLMPLAPLAPLAPQPAPPSPPNEVFIKQSPPLSPRIVAAPQTLSPSGATAIRRPSIVPALTPNMARTNSVLVKSTLIPEDKPQSEAAMTAQAKRQERLIKNRAAALLSRKRKREHINLLESHTDLLKNTNQELSERVSELEENVKVLTVERDTARQERDSARKECENLHRQIKVLTHCPQTDAFRMDMDLERNTRSAAETERGLNSKATGVVFMIILFSFALFNLPSGKLETLMVGGSMDRSRIGSSIVGRALDSYAKNPTISGQVRGSPVNRQELHNMTDLVVFSDNRALQTWLGHQPLSAIKSAEAEVATSSPTADKENVVIIASADADTKSVGFVAQTHEPLPWTRPEAVQDMSEPDRDAWLYCSNLLYSLRASSVSKASGPSQATNGEIRRPRMSIISPLDGVVGSNADEKVHLPPWMPNSNSNSKDDDSEQRYLRLDVEVTSSRVVSGDGLVDHEQVIRFPLMPVGVFDNLTTSLAPAKAAEATPISTIAELSEGRKPMRRTRSSRIDAQGGVGKIRRIYDPKGLKSASAAAAASRDASATLHSQRPTPLAPIKEEPMEVYIKEEPMD